MTIHVTLLEEEDLWKMDLNDPGKPQKKKKKKRACFLATGNLLQVYQEDP